MPAKITKSETAEMQIALVSEYLELCFESEREPNPLALRACAMLLAGSAELRDPPRHAAEIARVNSPITTRVEEVEPKTEQQRAFERGRDIEHACNPPVDDE